MSALPEIVSGEVMTSLEQDEASIENGLGGFREVGGALMRIQQAKKYQDVGYETFEDYCRERWDLSRRYAYDQMGAARVATVLELCANGAQIPVPGTERTIRPLVKVLNECGEDAVQKAWQEVVTRKLRQTDLVPSKRRITARDVARVVGPPPASSHPPGWFELLGTVGDYLIAADKAMTKTEKALHRTPNAKFREKAGVYAEWAEQIARRLREIENA